MRITQNMSATNSIYNIMQGRAKLDKLQELSSSGANVNRPSDDPIASRLLLDVNTKLKAANQYKSNIAKAETFMAITSTALQGMADTMALAKKVVANYTPGTTDTTFQANTISQLRALKQQMVDMGNTQLGDQYVFGGAVNDTPPFNGAAPHYPSGDETALDIEVGSNTTEQMNIPGGQLLKADTAVSQPYGTVDILKTFDDLIAAVTTNTTAAITPAANSLEEGAKQITNAQTDLASRMKRLESLSAMHANNINTLETIVGNTQNVDYAKLAVQISQQKIAFEASLSSTAQISKMSLLDFM